MQMNHYQYPRITIDPEVCFGKPCIRGMRMPVSSILAYLEAGLSYADVIKEFPYIEKEDISQALGYSAAIMDETFVPLQKAS